MADRYRVNEVFKSLQGEGVRAGTLNVFVRLSGCNMRCRVEPGEKSPGGFDCDTEFESGRWYSAAELFAWVNEVAGDCHWVIFTGGEPALQLDARLVETFRAGGFSMAIETNGSVDVSPLNLDWVTVSPKVAEHAVRQMTASEVKYVRANGQGIPRPTCVAEHKLLSPAFDGLRLDPESLAWCKRLIDENPDWRLSVQQHKAWGVR